jgi:hypothetical protein
MNISYGYDIPKLHTGEILFQKAKNISKTYLGLSVSGQTQIPRQRVRYVLTRAVSNALGFIQGLLSVNYSASKGVVKGKDWVSWLYVRTVSKVEC